MVKWIVEATWGTITAQSMVGKGSTFTFLLPYEKNKFLTFFNVPLIFGHYTEYNNKRYKKNSVEIERSIIMKKKMLVTAAVTLTLMGLVAGCGGKDIGESKAKEIALENAGVTESDISRYQSSKDRDDGKTLYEIQFCFRRYRI